MAYHTGVPRLATTCSVTIQTYNNAKQVVFMNGPQSSRCHSILMFMWLWFVTFLQTRSTGKPAESHKWEVRDVLNNSW